MEEGEGESERVAEEEVALQRELELEPIAGGTGAFRRRPSISNQPIDHRSQYTAIMARDEPKKTLERLCELEAGSS